MQISRKLAAALGVMVGLVTVGEPVRAHGAPIIAVVNEGSGNTLIPNAFTIMNTNAFAVTLTALGAANTNNSDNSDFLLGASVAASVAVGNCVPLLGVNGGFAANKACTVDLEVIPVGDVPETEPVDFGLTEVTLTYRIDNGDLMTQMATVQVNDVPEPGSVTMAGVGIVVLLSALLIGARRFRGGPTPYADFINVMPSAPARPGDFSRAPSPSELMLRPAGLLVMVNSGLSLSERQNSRKRRRVEFLRPVAQKDPLCNTRLAALLLNRTGNSV